jgi:nitrite reductase/ring-hydroxylating ferredoxin subunit
MANGRKIVIVRYKGKLHAVGGECTFDNTSLLAEGVCFGDKLFCCHHGCAFDIETGRVELPPAINNLPRFFV